MHADTGKTAWEAKLDQRFLRVGSGFTNVTFVGDALYAATHGHVFRLDPYSGDVLWESEASVSKMVEPTFAAQESNNRRAVSHTHRNID